MHPSLFPSLLSGASIICYCITKIFMSNNNLKLSSWSLWFVKNFARVLGSKILPYVMLLSTPSTVFSCLQYCFLFHLNDAVQEEIFHPTCIYTIFGYLFILGLSIKQTKTFLIILSMLNYINTLYFENSANMSFHF